MRWPCTVLAIVVWGIAESESLGGIVSQASANETDTANENIWEGSLSAAAYIVRNGRDYVNPILTADHNWLHLEARYNYEAYQTGSLWLGYNFGFGNKLAFEVTPMIGGVFGDIDGVAPGYTISISYASFELYTQGEYFFDSATHDGNFFYNWSEFSYSPTSWFRFGLVLDRTKALGSNFDVRRGPLIGFKYKKVDLTAYWLGPGSEDSTFVLAATLSF